jgi:peptide/nickel transport system substrate-binding protein
MKLILKKLPFAYISLLLLMVQIFVLGGPGSSKSFAANLIKIGILEEPRTLNIWLASDRWSLKVLGQIYHPLYVREPKNLRLIPWLASEDPVYDATNLSYTIRLRSAKWSDGSAFTSEDVAFTGDLIKEFKIPRHYSKWRFIKKIEILDRRTVRFFLDRPRAIFLTRTLTTPIVQKKEWEEVVKTARRAEKPLNQLLNHKVDRPVGTGPFILTQWKQGAFLYLSRNKHFFAQGERIGGHLLGPYIDGIILKVFGTSDAAILALKKGSVDMFWWGIQPGYLSDLEGNRDLRIFYNERSALYYLGFNVRKKPFSDVNFRRAVATLIDKDFILRRVLQGYGIKMQSIVPPGNTFWHLSDVPRYGEGLSREERIRKAYQILNKVGYTWKVPPVNTEGKVVKGQGIILPDGKPLEKIFILTPPSDYDPHRAMTGMMIQEWLKDIGIPASARPMAFSSLIREVKTRHHFDLFVLGYGRLSLDPDYLRNFFHSSNDRPGGWNMSGYKNLEFDRIADESSKTMDVERRRALIREMQKIIMGDIPYVPLYNPKLVEVVRTDKFRGWVEMLEGIGNTWSFCQIKPV